MFFQKAYNGNNKWYLYLVTLIIVFLVQQIASIPLVIYGAFQNPDILTGSESALASIMATNVGLALVLFTFLAGVVALLLCVVFFHKKRVNDILTGRNKFDYKRVLFGAGIWSLMTIVILGAQYGFGDTTSLVYQFDAPKFFVMLIIILLLIPFQVAYEEFIFRGYLMQGSALVLKEKWLALLFTGLVFGLLHGANPEIERFGFWVLMPQYILMGLILGYIAIKDDGLELALGLHLANNVISSVLVTHDSSALQTHAIFRDMNPQASHMDTVVLLVCGIVFIWLCNLKYKFWNKINIWEKIHP